MNTLIITILTLGVLGAVAALVLYFVAQKFKVFEDERIDLVEEVLPSANCGGCGFPGCRAFAEALVKADDISSLNCPVGGAPVMAQAAEILGKEITEADPLIAVVRCNGTCENRPKINKYDGAGTCAIAAATYGGDTGCSFGCLGEGDCVAACDFDAIHMDVTTGLPVVNDKCVACGACVDACPKNIIELRKRGKKERRIFVSCVNEDKGAAAKKACSAACIGCSKCFKECPFDAITMKNNLAYIDHTKCKLCRKCVIVCPTQAIHEINFPPRKPKPEKPKPAVKPKVVDKTNSAEVKPKVSTKTVSDIKVKEKEVSSKVDVKEKVVSNSVKKVTEEKPELSALEEEIKSKTKSSEPVKENIKQEKKEDVVEQKVETKEEVKKENLNESLKETNEKDKLTLENKNKEE